MPNDCSIIKCSILTVWPKLIFNNGYVDHHAELHVVVRCLVKGFWIAASLEKWFRIRWVVLDEERSALGSAHALCPFFNPQSFMLWNDLDLCFLKSVPMLCQSLTCCLRFLISPQTWWPWIFTLNRKEWLICSKLFECFWGQCFGNKQTTISFF